MDQISIANGVINVQKAMSIASMAVGLVFGYAAASKVLDVRGFVAGVRAYRIVPDRFAPFAAGALIVIEFSIALAHLTDVAVRVLAPATVALLLVFFAMTVITLKRGVSRSCLCFGVNRDDRVDIYTLARIGVLLATELMLCTYLALFDGSIAVRTTGVHGSVEMLWIAAFSIALVGWSLAIPRVIRAMHVVRS